MTAMGGDTFDYVIVGSGAAGAEPASIVLIGAGLLGLAAIRRKLA
jgi:choline dehydrogenase-like flavoprotein